MAVSTTTNDTQYWSALKRAHGKLPRGSTWSLAVSSTDGTRAVNVVTGDSVDGVRAFFEAHAGSYATTEYFEADAANAVGLAR
ncbi:MAG TPA: hypothetical protein VE172_21515 [Stackebrandtia sp.]|uniref:hypothetical protein n=1 Tax=Stackebrandtia sp. TaxID=2023065 RepID=UPI002D32E859|nr:hypothetical protein [Stackebrandtia sp.]HZE41387.1 hypothetical protein [Stackebrandtia sp.]